MEGALEATEATVDVLETCDEELTARALPTVETGSPRVALDGPASAGGSSAASMAERFPEDWLLFRDDEDRDIATPPGAGRGVTLMAGGRARVEVVEVAGGGTGTGIGTEGGSGRLLVAAVPLVTVVGASETREAKVTRVRALASEALSEVGLATVVGLTLATVLLRGLAVGDDSRSARGISISDKIGGVSQEVFICCFQLRHTITDLLERPVFDTDKPSFHLNLQPSSFQMNQNCSPSLLYDLTS